MKIRLNLNGKDAEIETAPEKMLAEVLREQLGLLGTKEGCGKGECGACTVLIDGDAVASCIYPAAKAAGKRVLTIEGLSQNGELHPIQRAYVDSGAIQCGFCTPGMILATKALLDREPHPNEEKIRAALSGNICRCTGYVRIVEAVKLAAKYLEEENGHG